MDMKRIVLTLAIAMAMYASAQKVAPAGTANRNKRYSSEARAAAIERSGGIVMRKDLGKGRILFVNCQKRVPAAVSDEVADALTKVLRFNVETTNGVFTALGDAAKALAATGANGALFIVDDGTLPAVVSAIEDRWAVVNVGAFAQGAEGAKLANRLKCELCRAFSATFGWASIHGGMMAVLKDAQGLDTLPVGSLGAENANRIRHQLKEIGLTSIPVGSYRSACVMGWAPPPANDLQRKIWEEEEKSRQEYDRKEAGKKAKKD